MQLEDFSVKGIIVANTLPLETTTLADRIRTDDVEVHADVWTPIQGSSSVIKYSLYYTLSVHTNPAQCSHTPSR